MKLTLKFTDEDFVTCLHGKSPFVKAVERQLGKDVYVGTNSLVWYQYHPEDLQRLLSPMTLNKQVPETFEFLGHTFKQKDFDTLRTFDTAVKKVVGPNVYVTGQYLAYFFDYPPTLVERLRPLCHTNQTEFELESSLPDAK